MRWRREQAAEVRFFWDYLTVLEWSDDSPDMPHEAQEVLPPGLVARVDDWGRRMDDAFGTMYEDDFPGVDAEVELALGAEYLAIRSEIEHLGYPMVPERGRFPFGTDVRRR